MADLLGHSVAITSMHTMKLEHFDKFGKHGKRKFKNWLLETMFQILQEMIIY